MSVQLNKDAYSKLIQEDIEAINKHMSVHSLERKHIVAVLEWSIDQIYDNNNTPLDWMTDDNS